MEKNPGALPHPGRVPAQELCPPRNLFLMTAEIGIASGEKGYGIRVSSAGVKIGAKGAPRGATGQSGGQVARPRAGLRQAPSWLPGGGPPVVSWLFRKLPER